MQTPTRVYFSIPISNAVLQNERQGSHSQSRTNQWHSTDRAGTFIIAMQQNSITAMDNECCVFPILPFDRIRAVSVLILSLPTICLQVYRLPDYENSPPNLIVRTTHHPEMLGFELDKVTAGLFGLFPW